MWWERVWELNAFDCHPKPLRVQASNASLSPLISLSLSLKLNNATLIRLSIGTMPSLIPLDNLLGAFFLGVVLSAMCEAAFDCVTRIRNWQDGCRLYGVTCLQVYSYFSQHCESDKPILRYFVGGLFHLCNVFITRCQGCRASVRTTWAPPLA